MEYDPASALDLFPFENDTSHDPESATDFITFARFLELEVGANTNEIDHEWRISTGSFAGDGRSASH